MAVVVQVAPAVIVMNEKDVVVAVAGAVGRGLISAELELEGSAYFQEVRSCVVAVESLPDRMRVVRVTRKRRSVWRCDEDAGVQWEAQFGEDLTLVVGLDRPKVEHLVSKDQGHTACTHGPAVCHLITNLK